MKIYKPSYAHKGGINRNGDGKRNARVGLLRMLMHERCLDGLAENAYAKRRKIEMQRFTLAAFRSLLSAINSRKIVLILGCYRIGFKVKTDIVYPKSELE